MALVCGLRALRDEVDATITQGLSSAELAADVRAIIDGVDSGIYGGSADAIEVRKHVKTSTSTRALSYRLAWVMVVFAPTYDPVLASTMLFCLENIEEECGTFDDLLDHLENAKPVDNAPLFPPTLEHRPLRTIKRQIAQALIEFRTNPCVQDRIVHRLSSEPLATPSYCASVKTDPDGENQRGRDVRIGVRSTLMWAKGEAQTRLRALVRLSSEGANWAVRMRATRELIALHKSQTPYGAIG